MDELVAWLRGRLDERERELAEDERVAREAAERAPFDEWDAVGSRADDEIGYTHWEVVRIARPAATPAARSIAQHIARHDPARVLAEVERGRRDIDGKRRLIEEIADEADGLDMQVDGEFRVGFRDHAIEPLLGERLSRSSAKG